MTEARAVAADKENVLIEAAIYSVIFLRHGGLSQVHQHA
jgi:hypothetical protein